MQRWMAWRLDGSTRFIQFLGVIDRSGGAGQFVLDRRIVVGGALTLASSVSGEVWP